MPPSPFPAELELNHDLLSITTTTTANEAQVQNNPPTIPLLPSQPQIHLSDTPQLTSFLTADLITADLNRLAPRLWLISTPKPSNVNPLHYQKVKNREIVLVEDPRLHLVWYHERIYVKPLPAYLLSYGFWRDYLSSSSSSSSSSLAAAGGSSGTSGLGKDDDDDGARLEEAALGLLRSYCYLIRHESDLRIAQQEHLQLVPPSVGWKEFCAFTAALRRSIEDGHVAPRYHYGEIRLSRLNVLVKILLFRRNYQEVYPQYAEYFAQFYGPLLFLFGVLSVLLSAMQVSLAVEQLKSRDWDRFYDVCRWLSIAVLGAVAVVLGWLATLLIVRVLLEVWYALKFQSQELLARLGAVNKGRPASKDSKQRGSV